ncbi:YegP family protein [Isoptericola sp. NPDC055881]
MRIEIYEATDGWRWRLKARNGRIVADSAEAYTRRRDVLRAVKRARTGMFYLAGGIEAR